MKTKIHPVSQKVEFSCLSCKTVRVLLSSHKDKKVNINICSNCHPFYQGKTNLERSLGPSEKLRAKFEVGKKRMQEQKNKTAQ